METTKLQVIFSLLALALLPPLGAVQFHSSLENFARKIFIPIYKSHGEHNIIYSPFSIQTCLTMVRTAAAGQTAEEMDHGLCFTGQSVESVADNYHNLLKKYENNGIVEIANKVYVMQGYQLREDFKDFLSENFYSSAENINFADSTRATNAINAWVESKTNNVIKDLIKPGTLDRDTRMFLLSAIHFKGNWEEPFVEEYTSEEDFHIDVTNTVKVQMMFDNRIADYASYPDLGATALRLPYKNSDLSMVIFLPDSRTGLEALQSKLKIFKLKSLLQGTFDRGRVMIYLPKFKAEFEITLNDVLKKMGMTKMFADADFSKMLKSPENLRVDTVIHKAFIDVNEVGTEAAAATGLKAVPYSSADVFQANHPFYYVIVDGESLPLFEGTFVGV